MNYVVIGNGVAGISCAFALREKDESCKIIVISDETSYFYSRTALMYIAMGDMRLEDTEPYERSFYKEKNIDLAFGKVTGLDSSAKMVLLSDNTEIPYDKVLLATGAKPAMFGWPGSDLDGVVNFVSYQDLNNVIHLIRRCKKNTNRAIVVGGGLIGIELVEVFLHHGLEVDFLIREKSFWRIALSPDEGRFLENCMKKQGAFLKLETEVAEVLGNDDGIVTGVKTKQGETIDCDIVAFTTGVRPNLLMAKNSGVKTDRGILTNWKLETNLEDVYAAGDCVEIETASEERNFSRQIWYSSRDMGRIAARNMAGEDVTYDPGEWYNSAKFFDVEYTCCGKNLAIDDTDETYFYVTPDGCQAVSIVHEKGTILGFNMLGGRWDHRVLLKFVRDHVSLDYFFKNYRDAWFDAEFSVIPKMEFTKA